MADETTTTTTDTTTVDAGSAAGTGKGAGGDAGGTGADTTTLLDGQGKAQGDDAGKGGKDSAGKGQDDKTQDGKEAKATGAPEKYEFKLPEGVTLDQAALNRFEPLFREANLSQDQASKLVGEYTKFRQEEQKTQAETWGKQVQDWGVAAKADPEIGGKGGKEFETNLRGANAVLDKYGTPELKALLGLPSKENPNGLGLGNHPELVRFMVRLAKAAGEDRQPEDGKGEGKEVKSIAQKFYPGMNP